MSRQQNVLARGGYSRVVFQLEDFCFGGFIHANGNNDGRTQGQASCFVQALLWQVRYRVIRTDICLYVLYNNYVTCLIGVQIAYQLILKLPEDICQNQLVQLTKADLSFWF